MFPGDEEPPPEGPWIELADDEDTPGSQRPGRRTDRGLGVDEVVERVDDDDGIDGAVGQWQLFGSAADRRVPASPGRLQHPGGGVDHDRGLPEGTHRTPGAAADVDDRLDCAGRQSQAGRQGAGPGRRHQDVVEAGEPIEGSDIVHTGGSTAEGPKPSGPNPGLMEFEVLGDAAAGPTLSLDHRRFAYAGKFVMSSTGKLVAREEDIVAAVSFSPDRTDEDRAWLRYLTVARDRRGEGIGPRVAAAATAHLHDRGFEEVRIGVNNPFAYQALYRAGFGWTGAETGVAELVLAHPHGRSASRYRDGLARFADRDDLSDAELSFIDAHRRADPPPVVDPPD